MNSSPILIVPGEKKSIFFEIFFKSIELKKIVSPLILVCSKKILDKDELNKQSGFNCYLNLYTKEQIKNIIF